MPTVDVEALRAKYLAERDKRIRREGTAQYNFAEGRLSHFDDDPHAHSVVPREALSASGYWKRARTEEGFAYENSFALHPAAVPWRPPRRTPRPQVRGTQSALVVGKSGEEIVKLELGTGVPVIYQLNADSTVASKEVLEG